MKNKRRRVGGAAAAAAAALAATALAAQGGLAFGRADAGGVPERLDPARLGVYLLGPNLARAEVVRVVRGEARLIRLDRGRVMSVTADAVTLRERDGTVVTVPVSPAARIRVNGRPQTLAEVRRGLVALTVREGDAPAIALEARAQRG